MCRVGPFFKPNIKQIHKAVQALREPYRILGAILNFVEKAEKRKKKLQGQYAYWKYLEIIRVGVYGYITKFWWWPKWAKLRYPLKYYFI